MVWLVPIDTIPRGGKELCLLSTPFLYIIQKNGLYIYSNEISSVCFRYTVMTQTAVERNNNRKRLGQTTVNILLAHPKV
jgi:hypothetical protein